MSTQAPTQPHHGYHSSNSLWDSMKAQGIKAGKQASIATQKAKIYAEIALLDNKMHHRKERFGIELYDALVLPAEQDPVFMIESDSLENIRGHFVTCFKDNKALMLKRAKKQQQLVELDERRAIAYPKVPCETFGGQMKNGCKAANFARQESQWKARIAIVEQEMKANKKKFGLEVYRLLVQLEDNQHWLPSDRDVRFLYDQARRDITKMITEKQQKKLNLSTLGRSK